MKHTDLYEQELEVTVDTGDGDVVLAIDQCAGDSALSALSPEGARKLAADLNENADEAERYGGVRWLAPSTRTR